MRGVFGKASAHLSEELKQGWRSLKYFCRLGSMGLYVTMKGILFVSCGSLFSLSASSLEVDVVFFMASSMHPLLYTLCRRWVCISFMRFWKRVSLEHILCSRMAKL